MSDYQDIDEWAAEADRHRASDITLDAGHGLIIRFRYLYRNGHPATTLVVEEATGGDTAHELDRVRIPEDFTTEELRHQAELLIAEVRLTNEQRWTEDAAHRMLISRRLVNSARAYVQGNNFDSTLPIVIRAGAQAGFTRDQMVDLLSNAYRHSGNRMPRPEGWEDALSTEQVDSSLAGKPEECEDARADEELSTADAIVSNDVGRDLMRAVDEAMRQERATAAAIVRRNEAIREALDAGLSQRRVASLSGLSQQRIAQIGRGE